MYDSMIMAKVKSKREALSREASHDRDADTGATVSQISAVFLLQARAASLLRHFQAFQVSGNNCILTIKQAYP